MHGTGICAAESIACLPVHHGCFEQVCAIVGVDAVVGRRHGAQRCSSRGGRELSGGMKELGEAESASILDSWHDKERVSCSGDAQWLAGSLRGKRAAAASHDRYKPVPV